jgi:hypothetical protein
MITDE